MPKRRLSRLMKSTTVLAKQRGVASSQSIGLVVALQAGRSAIQRSAAEPQSKRSAPVLGLSDARQTGALRRFPSFGLLAHCCARGRAHSDAVGKIVAT